MIIVSKKRVFWWSVVVVGVFSVVHFAGLEWRKEWDVHSGKERVVSSIFGIDYSQSDELETSLSECLSKDPEEEKWLVVARGGSGLFGGCVSYYYFKIEREVLHFRAPGLHGEGRAIVQRRVASTLLEKLDETQDIGEVYNYFQALLKRFDRVNWYENEGSELEVVEQVIEGGDSAWKRSE